MSTNSPGHGGPQAERRSGLLDEVCSRFEAAWCEGRQPRIEDFLSPESPDRDVVTLRKLLVSLVGIDLEHRWRMAAETGERQPAGGEAAAAVPETGLLPPRPRLADYVARYPALGPLEQLPIDLVVDEYYARRRFGDRPTHAEYLETFGRQHPELEERFRAIDEEVASARAPSPALPANDGLPLGASVQYFGDYELLERLGKGGMGVVYKARQVSLKRLVALKMILAGQLADEQDIARFHVEAEAAANLDHPGIVRIFEIGQHQGQHYFSMGYVDGESLDARLKASPLPPCEAAQLMEQVARAVAYAHAQGVIHRDLKPANILVDKNHRPHVTDFGLAKRVQGDSSLTATGVVLGTPSYMPPEQAAGRIEQINEQSDVYSLGATLYALLVGRPPFQAATSLETLIQVREQESMPLRQLNPKLPGDLETVCAKCLEKDPRQRYNSAHELGEELRRFLSGEPIHARPVGRTERLWRWCKRNPVVAALSAAALLLLLMVVLATSVGYMKTNAALTIAQSERDRAEVEQRRAEASLASEAAARRNAEARRQQAEEEKRKSAQNRYYVRIALAEQNRISGEVQESERLLDVCPVPFRQWEWGYLKRLCHLDLLTLRGHADYVSSVAFSPDGKRLATGSGDKTVKIWDAATGREMLTLRGHKDIVWGVAFSPDGKRLATGSGDGTVKIWDVDTGKEVRTLRENGVVIRSVAFSPDGKRLAAGGDDETVMIWDAATGQKTLSRTRRTRAVRSMWERFGLPNLNWLGLLFGVSSIGFDLNFDLCITSVAFSPDGKRLATGSLGHSVKIWDATTGQEILMLRGHVNGLVSVAFSPDGRQFATAGGDDKTVQTWDLASGREMLILRGHTETVGSVAFSPDGKWLATSGGDAVRIWDLATGREILFLRGPNGGAGVAFSQDGKRLAAGSGDKANIWDLPTGQEMLTLCGPAPFSGDGSEELGVSSVAFSPDGKRLATGSDSVRIWDAATGREMLTLPVRAISVAFSMDGRRLATGSEEKTAIWDAATGREMLALRGHAPFFDKVTGELSVSSVAFSPDGRRLATVGCLLTPTIWDAVTGQKLLTLRGHAADVSTVAFSPDGKRLAAGSTDKTVGIWDTVTGQKLLTLRGHAADVSTVAFSPDGKRLATGSDDKTVMISAPRSSDKTVKIWDTVTGQELLTLRGHAAGVSTVAFSPNGKRLATGSNDKTVKIWDTVTGQELLTLRGHAAGVLTVAFSPDGKRLATGSADKTVKIWEGGIDDWPSARTIRPPQPKDQKAR
jgi:eukaryotic-like serine/threonine-protein kinase